MKSWTFTMDADGHTTIYCNGSAVFEGSYEAFCAEAGVDFDMPPKNISEMIHARADKVGLLGDND